MDKKMKTEIIVKNINRFNKKLFVYEWEETGIDQLIIHYEPFCFSLVMAHLHLSERLVDYYISNQNKTCNQNRMGLTLSQKQTTVSRSKPKKLHLHCISYLDKTMNMHTFSLDHMQECVCWEQSQMSDVTWSRHFQYSIAQFFHIFSEHPRAPVQII